MLEPLTRPFKRHYDKYRGKLAMFPRMEAFAGSEDLAGEGNEAEDSSTKTGIKAKLKNFKKSLKELSDFQKLLLLTIAVVLPAGILISVTIAGLLKRRK